MLGSNRNMMRGGGPAIVLWAVLGAVASITVTTTKNTLEVARGDNITLPCSYQTKVLPEKRKFTTAKWEKISSSEDTPSDVIIYTTGEDLTVGTDYTGRVTFGSNVEQGTANILISKVTMADNGTYHCEIMIPSDMTGTRTDSVRLLVLVAPSTPICQIEGTAEYGQNIRLTCRSAEGSPAPTYTWQSYSPQNQLRQMPPKSSQDGGFLSLTNISIETSGFFICTSANRIRSVSCNMTLSVMPPSMNFGFYAGIIGGIVGGIIILGIIIYCCCCREKDNPEDYEMEDPGVDPGNPREKLYDKVPSEDEDDHINHETQPMPPPNKPKSLPRSDHEEA